MSQPNHKTAAERTPERLQGVVQARTVRGGTASEHMAPVLVTGTGERLVLVRLGGNPFQDVPALKLDGRRVEVQGFRLGNELRFTALTPLD